MSRRSISTSQLALRAKPLRSVNVSQSVSRVARRSYADAAAPTPSPAPKPKKRFRVLRWAWRLTWLSAIGLTGAVAYSIFELRQPPNQSPPDPSKKTLVILGRFL
jgi:NADH:ubiquinone reductase (non-electrogenic)